MSADDRPDRPEYVACIKHRAVAMKGRSWCNRRLFRHEWAFIDVDHASVNGHQRGRLVACPQCVEAVIKALRNGSES